MLTKLLAGLSGILSVIAVRLALSVLTYPTFCIVMERARPWRSMHALSPSRIVTGIAFAARFIPGSTCLVKCYAARLLLTLSGKRTTLHLGVGRGAKSELQAHAWLELGGVTVVGKVDQRQFTELKEYVA